MIEVFANGRKFSYWTSAKINRSLDHIAATFNLNVIAVDKSGNPVKLFPGDSVEIAVNGNTVIRGYVEKFSASFANGTHAFTVSGSEISCDIADCCIESPLEWKNKTLVQIAEDICCKLGIQFINEYGVDPGKPINKFSVDPGVKALETITKLCRERGIIPCSNGLGQVYLFKPSGANRGPKLVQGENLLSASMDFSINNRYSVYNVFGSGKAKSKVVASRSDSDVGRYRPLIIVDSNATQKESVEARAEWEYNIRKAKSMNFKCSVQGWNSNDGIWEPGVISSFYAPALCVNDPLDLLISSVEYSWNESGEITNVSLVSPDVYLPQPEVKKSSSKTKTRVSAKSPWDSIKKAVKG